MIYRYEAMIAALLPQQNVLLKYIYFITVKPCFYKQICLSAANFSI